MQALANLGRTALERLRVGADCIEVRTSLLLSRSSCSSFCFCASKEDIILRVWDGMRWCQGQGDRKMQQSKVWWAMQNCKW